MKVLNVKCGFFDCSCQLFLPIVAVCWTLFCSWQTKIVKHTKTKTIFISFQEFQSMRYCLLTWETFGVTQWVFLSNFSKGKAQQTLNVWRKNFSFYPHVPLFFYSRHSTNTHTQKIWATQITNKYIYPFSLAKLNLAQIKENFFHFLCVHMLISLFFSNYSQFVRLYDRYKKYKMSTNRNWVPMQLNLIGQVTFYLMPAMIVFIFFPACLFTYFEGWEYTISVYYAFVTLTTIGKSFSYVLPLEAFFKLSGSLPTFSFSI